MYIDGPFAGEDDYKRWNKEIVLLLPDFGTQQDMA